MLRRILVTLATGLLLTAGPAAQESKPVQPPPEKPPQPAAPARDDAKRTNVKLDLTITDQSAPGEAAKRTVSMILADRQGGSIRSAGSVIASGTRINVTLNVDARPQILDDNRILLDLTLEYAPKPISENANTGEGRSHLTERLALIVDPGKPMVISNASDPTSDRRITVELMATMLK
jgi:hypothetical protein